MTINKNYQTKTITFDTRDGYNIPNFKAYLNSVFWFCDLKDTNGPGSLFEKVLQKDKKYYEFYLRNADHMMFQMIEEYQNHEAIYGVTFRLADRKLPVTIPDVDYFIDRFYAYMEGRERVDTYTLAKEFSTAMAESINANNRTAQQNNIPLKDKRSKMEPLDYIGK